MVGTQSEGQAGQKDARAMNTCKNERYRGWRRALCASLPTRQGVQLFSLYCRLLANDVERVKVVGKAQ